VVARQNSRAQQRAQRNAQHDGHGETGIDVAALEVYPRTGGGRDPDHEVTRGGEDFEGDAHRLVHGDHLERSRANAEESGESPRHKQDGSGGEQPALILRTLRTLIPQNCQKSEFCSDIKNQSGHKPLALTINEINI
jgi:hypothetical protein